MPNYTTPNHVLNFQEQITCFQICNNDFAYNLICFASERKLTLGLIQFPEESEADVFAWERIKDIHHESRCHALCFAPETSFAVIPKIVTFCAAGADFILRIFRTDLQNSDTVQALKGHTNYINEVNWDVEGEYLASVSDDHSCKIWNVESNFETVTTFCLSSAGMSVKWHPEDQSKVLVAEKKGIVHMYNVRSQQAIISIETPKFPLMSADWSLDNRLCVATLAGGDVVTWDLRHPSSPTDKKQMHEDCGRVIKFSPNSDLVMASVGRPDITLKVFTAKSVVPLIEAPLKLFGGIAFHNRLPYIGAACDRKICFWKIRVK